MPTTRSFPGTRFVPTLCAALLALAGCSETRRAPRDLLERAPSRVDVLLRASNPPAFAVELHLVSVTLRTEQGETHALELAAERVSSSEFTRRRPLAAAATPPGAYAFLDVRLRAAERREGDEVRSLRLVDPQGEVRPPDETTDPLRPAEPGITLSLPLAVRLARQEALSLFLDWDVASSLVEEFALRPVVRVDLERPTVRLGLLYVADEASGTVLAVNRFSSEIVKTAKVGRGPTALAASSDQRTLLACNGEDGSLSVLDTLQDYATTTIPVRLGARPADVLLLPDDRTALVLNRGLDTVTFLDVPTNGRLGDVRVGREPRRLLTSPRSRRVFVVNHLTDDVTVIDVATRRVVATIEVESGPVDGTIDRRERTLYVAHENSPNLVAIDLETLSRTQSLPVGRSATTVLRDLRRDRVFVARAQPPEIAVLDTTLRSVTRRIPLGHPVVQLAQPRDGPFLYGASPAASGVLVVNVLVGREEAALPCGGRPVDVIAVDE